jgi:hypothetical protein
MPRATIPRTWPFHCSIWNALQYDSVVKCTGNPRVHLGLPVPLPNKTHTRLPGTGILTGQLSATHGYGDNRTRGGLPTGLRANL